ncbi:MAG: hypothetical protein NC831_03250 [Candidatus Omnitrophica bacterium]|nr:hypothetical protein [Candidatus Omnitrophota bacterium]MCM8829003.1 hypothetical protein [Candidatus Omnitrophota bacterium]
MLPEKLILLNAVVRKSKASNIIAKLLNAGFFHPYDASSIPGMDENIRLWQSATAEKWKNIEKRFNFIVSETKFSFSTRSTPISFVEAETFLSTIEETLNPLLEEKHRIQQEISHLQDFLEKKPVYMPFISDSFTFIHTEIGEIKAGILSILENMLETIPHLLIPGAENNGYLIVGVVVLKKDISIFERIKKEVGWSPAPSDILISDTTVEQYREQITTKKTELEKNTAMINQFIEKNRDTLEKISTSLEIYQKISIAGKHTASTETTIIISGWIPENQKQSAIEIIRKTDPLSYCRCVVAEKTGIPLEQIPVKLKNNRFFKPFELIVKTYGLPVYGMLDPTAFVAFSFLLMFGAMFGDIGHGAIFVLLGLLMLWKSGPGIKQAGHLATYAGISSMIFGFLYGSFFGIEFHPFWINPMENISSIFRTCIIFGGLILSAGIIFNIANRILNRDTTGFLFDKAGLFSGLIFWSGAGIAALYFSKAESVFIKIFAAVFALCIFAIFSRRVFESLRHKEGILVGFIEGGLEIFEIMLGYVANTVSFIRIAAFALNHFGFFMTIFAISDMLKRAQMNWLSWVSIIFGNILVIGLEGLVVMIQSLRLNYYEFFSRFFVAGKTAYQPLVLKSFSEKIEEYLT